MSDEEVRVKPTPVQSKPTDPYGAPYSPSTKFNALPKRNTSIRTQSLDRRRSMDESYPRLSNFNTGGTVKRAKSRPASEASFSLGDEEDDALSSIHSLPFDPELSPMPLDDVGNSKLMLTRKWALTPKNLAIVIAAHLFCWTIASAVTISILGIGFGVVAHFSEAVSFAICVAIVIVVAPALTALSVAVQAIKYTWGWPWFIKLTILFAMFGWVFSALLGAAVFVAIGVITQTWPTWVIFALAVPTYIISTLAVFVAALSHWVLMRYLEARNDKDATERINATLTYIWMVSCNGAILLACFVGMTTAIAIVGELINVLIFNSQYPVVVGVVSCTLGVLAAALFIAYKGYRFFLGRKGEADGEEEDDDDIDEEAPAEADAVGEETVVLAE
ncbi:hypothetical protein J8273_0359 [Carpediemonas membranifera]|uniref:Uncharacterized protein n=1 Tax=Carpediemonas membranifera TaxID=201153 RepID=A0A8J6EAR1_9EUKA|nr:hypothetical protein J8273_0359 [Carpediemonas membranifera]|eukprot:KAG9395140.1 hypothetical protein J8273_0359 [Carpediemonas membranifera]